MIEILRKALSVILCITFSLSNLELSIAQEKNPKTITLIPSISPRERFPRLDVANILTPPKWGLLKMAHDGSSDRFIIHIQDAHAQLEAQENISRLIDHFVQQYWVKDVFIEGAEGLIDVSSIRTASSLEVNKRVGEYLLKEGIITGPEYLAMTTREPFRLWGGEDTTLHDQNLNEFREAMRLSLPVRQELEKLSEACESLKAKFYSKELLELDQTFVGYHEKGLEAKKYLRELHESAKRLGFSLDAFPTFVSLMKAQAVEETLDYAKVDGERKELVQTLNQFLSKEELQDLVKQSLLVRLGKLSPVDYDTYLGNVIHKVRPELLIERFTRFGQYLKYLSLFPKENPQAAFEEADRLELAVKEEMLKTGEEKKIAQLSRDLGLLKNFFGLSLTSGDYSEYRKRKDELGLEKWIEEVTALDPSLNLANSVGSDGSLAQEKAQGFYETALHRDEVIADTVLAQMGANGVRSAILVTGGFHTDGMLEKLNRQGVSFLVLTPNISVSGSDLYFRNVMQDELPLQSLVKSLYHWGAEASKVYRAAFFGESESLGILRLLQIAASGDQTASFGPFKLIVTREPLKDSRYAVEGQRVRFWIEDERGEKIDARAAVVIDREGHIVGVEEEDWNSLETPEAVEAFLRSVVDKYRAQGPEADLGADLYKQLSKELQQNAAGLQESVRNNPKRLDGLRLPDGSVVRVLRAAEDFPPGVQDKLDQHYAVFEIKNEKLGYVSYMAIHRLTQISSPLEILNGQWRAIGGTRIHGTAVYSTPEAALRDALELSREMSSKDAGAELPIGGSKCTIQVQIDPKRDGADHAQRLEILKSYAQAIEAIGHLLGGGVLTGQDQNIKDADVDFMHEFAPTSMTPNVAPKLCAKPSEPTAAGVFEGILAAVPFAFDGDELLAGKVIALQGLGSVGGPLLPLLLQAGAKVIASDTDPELVKSLKEAYKDSIESGQLFIFAEEKYQGAFTNYIFDVLGKFRFEMEKMGITKIDIFSPCATGRVLSDMTIMQLHNMGVKLVAGSANDVTVNRERHARWMHELGILYIPDYIINAGGVTAVAGFLGHSISVVDIARRVAQSVKNLLVKAFARNRMPQEVADRDSRTFIGKLTKAPLPQGKPMSVETWTRMDAPLGVEGVLTNFGLEAEGVEVLQLRGTTDPQKALSDPQVKLALGASIAQALASSPFMGGGKEIKEVADANAVRLTEESIKAYVLAHPNEAIVILADEGKRDQSVFLDVGSIYYAGYPNFHFRFDDATMKIENVRDRIAALKKEGVKIRYFVGDALEVTNGLADQDAQTKPTNSWSLFSLLDDGDLDFVVDQLRIGGVTFNSKEDPNVRPFDLPSEALAKIARSRGIDPDKDPAAYADFVNHVAILTLGPRAAGAKKPGESEKRHRHQDIIDDAGVLQNSFPGLKIILPGDGDLMSRVLAAQGANLDGYELIVFGRSGSAEATAAKLVASVTPGAYFPHSVVSNKATEEEGYKEEVAYQYTDGEKEALEKLGVPTFVATNPADVDPRQKGVLSMTSVTGASEEVFGQTFADRFQRVTFTENEDGSGTVTTNTYVVGRDGGAYVVRSHFKTRNIAKTKTQLEEASPEARLHKLSKIAPSAAEKAKSIENKELRDWVVQQALLTGAEDIELVGEDDDARLLEEAIAAGELVQLADGNYYARSHSKDVARSEERTFVATQDPKDKGLYNNWRSTDEIRPEVLKRVQGGMAKKKMYVIPYLMGPANSVFSSPGVELTDSRYVALNMIRMTRVGQVALTEIEQQKDFVKGLHVTGDLDRLNRSGGPDDDRYFVIFPDERTLISYGSAYGGNAILAKKFHALRQLMYDAMGENKLAEHMAAIEIEDTQTGQRWTLEAAFPSASGKTNFAMMGSLVPGGRYKVHFISDDIVGNAVIDGELRAVQMENGLFGVVPGTNSETNANAMKAIGPDTRTIFTNVAYNSQTGEVWWEGKTPDYPENVEGWLDWQGKPISERSAEDQKNKKLPWAHPNSRFTASVAHVPNLSAHWQDVHGVPVHIIFWGGRESAREPYVRVLPTIEAGVYDGAVMGVETTAAAEGKAGVMRRDPYAVRPFMSSPEGQYIAHRLAVMRKLGKAPLIAHVNWFRKSRKTGEFLWPGYGWNIVAGLFLIARLQGKTDGIGEAVETPMGLIPTPNAIKQIFKELGIEQPISDEALEELLSVDHEAWVQEALDRRAYLATIPDLPEEIAAEQKKLEEGLGLVKPPSELEKLLGEDLHGLWNDAVQPTAQAILADLQERFSLPENQVTFEISSGPTGWGGRREDPRYIANILRVKDQRTGRVVHSYFIKATHTREPAWEIKSSRDASQLKIGPTVVYTQEVNADNGLIVEDYYERGSLRERSGGLNAREKKIVAQKLAQMLFKMFDPQEGVYQRNKTDFFLIGKGDQIDIRSVDWGEANSASNLTEGNRRWVMIDHMAGLFRTAGSFLEDETFFTDLLQRLLELAGETSEAELEFYKGIVRESLKSLASSWVLGKKYQRLSNVAEAVFKRYPHGPSDGPRSALEKGWVIANHILVAFHAAFISSILSLPESVKGKNEVLHFMFTSWETLVSLAFWYTTFHIGVWWHERGHYWQAVRTRTLKKELLPAAVEVLEKGGLKRLWWEIKMFALTALGRFPGIKRVGLGYYVDAPFNLSVAAQGPRQSGRLAQIALPLGIALITAGLIVGISPLVYVGRLAFGIGAVGLLDRLLADPGKLKEFTEQEKKAAEARAQVTSQATGGEGWLSEVASVAQRMRETRPAEVRRADGKMLKNPWGYRNSGMGGRHTEKQYPESNISLQEAMFIPLAAKSAEEAQEMTVKLQGRLQALLNNPDACNGCRVMGIGLEGGLAPYVTAAEGDPVPELTLWRLMKRAIEDCGYKPGRDVALALDPAASELAEAYKKEFEQPDAVGMYLFWRDRKQVMTRDQLLDLYRKAIAEGIPIVSIEDGFSEDDWDGWKNLMKEFGDKLIIVGDDLVTTNDYWVEEAAKKGTINTLLTKANQIGSLSETTLAMLTALGYGMELVISHRSQSPNDDMEAQIALAMQAMGLKAGGGSNTERLVKYQALVKALGEAAKENETIRKLVAKLAGTEGAKLTDAEIRKFRENAIITGVTVYEEPTNSGIPTVGLEISVGTFIQTPAGPRIVKLNSFTAATPLGTSAGTREAIHLVDTMLELNALIEKHKDLFEAQKDGTYRFKKGIKKADIENRKDTELLDLWNETQRFGGKGVRRAVRNVEEVIEDLILGKTAAQLGSLEDIDRLLLTLEVKTARERGKDMKDPIYVAQRKSNLGMNAILSTSLALGRFKAWSQGKALWEPLQEQAMEIMAKIVGDEENKPWRQVYDENQDFETLKGLYRKAAQAIIDRGEVLHERLRKHLPIYDFDRQAGTGEKAEGAHFQALVRPALPDGRPNPHYGTMSWNGKTDAQEIMRDLAKGEDYVPVRIEKYRFTVLVESRLASRLSQVEMQGLDIADLISRALEARIGFKPDSLKGQTVALVLLDQSTHLAENHQNDAPVTEKGVTIHDLIGVNPDILSMPETEREIALSVLLAHELVHAAAPIGTDHAALEELLVNRDEGHTLALVRRARVSGKPVTLEGYAAALEGVSSGGPYIDQLKDLIRREESAIEELARRVLGPSDPFRGKGVARSSDPLKALRRAQRYMGLHPREGEALEALHEARIEAFFSVPPSYTQPLIQELKNRLERVIGKASYELFMGSFVAAILPHWRDENLAISDSGIIELMMRCLERQNAELKAHPLWNHPFYESEDFKKAEHVVDELFREVEGRATIITDPELFSPFHGKLSSSRLFKFAGGLEFETVSIEDQLRNAGRLGFGVGYGVPTGTFSDVTFSQYHGAPLASLKDGEVILNPKSELLGFADVSEVKRELSEFIDAVSEALRKGEVTLRFVEGKVLIQVPGETEPRQISGLFIGAIFRYAGYEELYLAKKEDTTTQDVVQLLNYFALAADLSVKNLAVARQVQAARDMFYSAVRDRIKARPSPTGREINVKALALDQIREDSIDLETKITLGEDLAQGVRFVIVAQRRADVAAVKQELIEKAHFESEWFEEGLVVIVPVIEEDKLDVDRLIARSIEEFGVRGVSLDEMTFKPYVDPKNEADSSNFSLAVPEKINLQGRTSNVRYVRVRQGVRVYETLGVLHGLFTAPLSVVIREMRSALKEMGFTDEELDELMAQEGEVLLPPLQTGSLSTQLMEQRKAAEAISWSA